MKPNYQGQKRKKELERQRKQEEKALRKKERKALKEQEEQGAVADPGQDAASAEPTASPDQSSPLDKHLMA